MEETTKESELSESMECLSVENKMGSSKRYSMRRRVAPKVSKEPEVRNRRCNMRPKKRSHSTMENDNDDEIREYYLDKSIKKKTPTTTLETIYEEIDGMNENAQIVNGRKLKRLIQFNGKVSDAKIKKRKAKVKRLKLNSNNTMPALLKKLNGIITESSSSSSSSTSTKP